MTSGPPFQQNQQAYAQGVGTTSTGRNFIASRNPNPNDVNYPIGQFWQNTSNQTLWYLNSQTSFQGVLQSNWVAIGTALDEIAVQTGTSPVVPTIGGVITFNGAVVAAGTHPVRTDGTGANTMALEVQISQSIAATDATKIGLSAFNSNQFSVDANGFVSLSGGGQAIDSIGTQAGTNPIVPTGAGLVTINGAVVAAGSTPIQSDGTGPNTMAIQVQTSQAIAATDATKIGLSAYNSAHFSVDANGFVSLVGGGEAVDSFQPDTGTNPVVPNASGLVAIRGQSTPNVSGIQVTGGTNELDIAMFSPFSSTNPFIFSGTGGLISSDHLYVGNTVPISPQDVNIERTKVGSQVIVDVRNLDNTNTSSGSQINIITGGASAGDSTIQMSNGITNWIMGLDNTASDQFVIAPNNTLGVSDALTISTTGDTSIILGNFSVNRSNAGSTVASFLGNNSATASSDAAYTIQVNSGTAGNPYTMYSIGGVTAWTEGILNSDSDSFNICQSSTFGTNVKLKIATTGAITFNSAYTFPLADGSAGQSLVTNGAGQLSFSSNSALLTYTAVNSTPYVVLSSDEFISVNTGTAKTIQLPNTTTTGRVVIVKDRTGTAGANNITITTVGGAVNIDGATTYAITVNFGSASFLFNGSTYEVY